jgi:hypothetical protein
MCRNHRGVIEATVARSKVGADIVYLDPCDPLWALGGSLSLRTPQVLIYDDELSDRICALASTTTRLIARCEPGLSAPHATFDELAREAPLMPCQSEQDAARRLYGLDRSGGTGALIRSTLVSP